MLVKDIEDILADLSELGLDLLTVLLDKSDLALVALGLLLLLDRGDDSPGSTAGANDVLVGNGQPDMNISSAFFWVWGCKTYKLRSSTESSWSSEATCFMLSTISS